MSYSHVFLNTQSRIKEVITLLQTRNYVFKLITCLLKHTIMPLSRNYTFGRARNYALNTCRDYVCGGARKYDLNTSLHFRRTRYYHFKASLCDGRGGARNYGLNT